MKGKSAVSATTQRYADVRAKDRYYVALKLRTDPLARLLCSEESHLGDVVDVGCGRGQFALLLWELGRARTLRGYDWDPQKINSARIAAGAAARFEVADLRTPPCIEADTILAFDVLQYLGPDEQRRLLELLANSLRPGGRLLLRTVDRAQGRPAILSRMLERLGRALRMNRSHILTFRPSLELKAELEALGLTVRSVGKGDSSWLDNRLWIAERAK